MDYLKIPKLLYSISSPTWKDEEKRCVEINVYMTMEEYFNVEYNEEY